MARYDIHRNPNPRTRSHTPYLLDVQADVLLGMSTRVLVPLCREEAAPKGLLILQPRLEVEGERMVMLTSLLAGVPLTAIGERVGGAEGQGPAILAALDFLFTGS